MKLSVMSYNIHQSLGTDGVTSVDRIAGIINRVNPDVIALQEVRILQEGGMDILSKLAQTSGYFTIPGPTMNREDSSYGNALLLKEVPQSTRQIPLSVPGREPRGAIQAIFTMNNKRIQVLATHLGLSPRERREQVRQLIRIIDDSEDSDRLLLCGDMNEWFLWGRPLRWLHRVFTKPPHRKTFPARFPVLALDRIWVSPLASLTDFSVVRRGDAKLASDHLPILAGIRI